jgi:hypothetical protein
MAQQGQRKALVARTLCGLICSSIMLAVSPLPSQAEELEIREFKVKIDGKAAGDYKMTISRHADGTEVMAGKADVSVRFWGILYTYKYEGTETWKDGRLWQLKSASNDDGKKFAVDAAAEGDKLGVTANGQGFRLRWDVWTTTYWHAPVPRFEGQVMPLIDADTGKDIQSTLQKAAGLEAVNVAGQLQNCKHYTLRGGGLEVDLWYDAQDRLVREEATESGHKTRLELARIRR